MTTLIFVRHGETSWSRTKEHTIRGRIDISLNENGKRQATAVGESLKNEKIYCVYSSPLERSFKTAEAIARHHGLPVTTHQDFIDLDFGDWQGKLHEDLERNYPGLYAQWINSPETVEFPHGETLGTVRERIETAISELVVKHRNETICIVSHGVVLRIVLCYLHNQSIDKYWNYHMDNCAITIVEYDQDKFHIKTENDISHLKNLKLNG